MKIKQPRLIEYSEERESNLAAYFASHNLYFENQAYLLHYGKNMIAPVNDTHVRISIPYKRSKDGYGVIVLPKEQVMLSNCVSRTGEPLYDVYLGPSSNKFNVSYIDANGDKQEKLESVRYMERYVNFTQFAYMQGVDCSYSFNTHWYQHCWTDSFHKHDAIKDNMWLMSAPVLMYRFDELKGYQRLGGYASKYVSASQMRSCVNKFSDICSCSSETGQGRHTYATLVKTTVDSLKDFVESNNLVVDGKLDNTKFDDLVNQKLDSIKTCVMSHRQEELTTVFNLDSDITSNNFQLYIRSYLDGFFTHMQNSAHMLSNAVYNHDMNVDYQRMGNKVQAVLDNMEKLNTPSGDNPFYIPFSSEDNALFERYAVSETIVSHAATTYCRRRSPSNSANRENPFDNMDFSSFYPDEFPNIR